MSPVHPTWCDDYRMPLDGVDTAGRQKPTLVLRHRTRAYREGKRRKTAAAGVPPCSQGSHTSISAIGGAAPAGAAEEDPIPL